MENKKRILEMVAENKISVDEAARLLELVEEPAVSSPAKKTPKYLRVTIRPEAADKVDAALKEKGIGFNLRNIKEEDIEQLINALSDLEVDIEGGKGKVNIYTE